MKFYQFIDEQDVEFRSSTEKEKLNELSRDNSLKQKIQNLYFEFKPQSIIFAKIFACGAITVTRYYYYFYIKS